MADLRLPGLTIPNAVRPHADIRCAMTGCGATTHRDVRLADSLPAPADAGWFEVALPAPSRTVLFACCRVHGQLVALGHHGFIRDGLRAFSDQPVLPGET